MRKNARVLMTITGLFIATSASSESGEDQAMTARDVLGRMGKTYVSCKSYHDSGVVKTVFIKAGNERIVEKPFKTAFVRPDRFRFEYSVKKQNGDSPDRYIVWRNRQETKTWWDIRPGIEEPESLGLALAGATGVSGGSAHTIPALLLSEEVGGASLTDMTEITRIADKKIKDVDCFRIKGKYGDHSQKLWIDKSTFLVLRIDEDLEFDNFRTETTTTYTPEIDVEIEAEELAFDSPTAE